MNDELLDAVDGVVGSIAPSTRPSCMSCGSHLARSWRTADGTAWLCDPCATLHGLGCP